MKESLNIKTYIGIIAEDKLYNQKLVKVYVNVLLPFFNGKLKDYTATETMNIINDNLNIKEKISVKTSNTITAEYFGLFSNRTTPPDVRKGEQVIVFELEDLNSYFWIPLSRDDNLRRLEHVRFHACDSKDPVKDLNEDNMYYIELDTLHSKTITLRTCKADGEQYEYLLKIDAKNNFFTLEDDSGNIIKIDSNDPKIIIRNRNEAFAILDKDDIFIQNHDKSLINLIKNIIIAKNADGSSVEINGPDIVVNAIGKVVINSGGDAIITANGNASVTANGVLSLSGAAINMSSLPNICPHK